MCDPTHYLTQDLVEGGIDKCFKELKRILVFR